MTTTAEPQITQVTNPTVIVQNVSVTYKTPLPSSDTGAQLTLKERLNKRLLGREPMDEVHAVKEVSFVAKDGDFIGLIGSNGAGKSTLLRTIAGAEAPTSGSINAVGQPVLLGVSAALLPNLSGYQNARLGCLAMGMTPEATAEAIPGIMEFAQLGSAIHRPMKTYSSGMAARLRFAISTASNPEILLIDEALSTGDATFQERSQERMQGLLSKAGTIFLVSHSARTVESMCNRAIWMHQGELVADGDAEEVAGLYIRWARYTAKKNFKGADSVVRAAKTRYPVAQIQID